MYSVICDGPRRFMSSVCLDCASGASPAADTRISKRGSLVLIVTSCENRPGSGRILLPPDQSRQFSRTDKSAERDRRPLPAGICVPFKCAYFDYAPLTVAHPKRSCQSSKSALPSGGDTYVDWWRQSHPDQKSFVGQSLT